MTNYYEIMNNLIALDYLIERTERRMRGGIMGEYISDEKFERLHLMVDMYKSELSKIEQGIDL